MTLDREEMMRRELRSSVVHEYAHVHVARHYKVLAHARIHFNPNAESSPDQRFFTGQCHFLSAFPSCRAARLTALAGTIAEMMDDNPEIDESDAEVEWLELSDTDAKLAGEYAERDVIAVMKLLRKLWPLIEQEVARLARLELYADEIQALGDKH